MIPEKRFPRVKEEDEKEQKLNSVDGYGKKRQKKRSENFITRLSRPDLASAIGFHFVVMQNLSASFVVEAFLLLHSSR
jgi:hypothetical protein